MDNLIEQLVKKSNTIGTTVKKIAIVVITVLVVVGSFFPLMSIFPSIWFLVTVGLIALDVFLFRRMNIEYEYVFFNGELDIDRISNRASRKRLYSTNFKEAVLIAPTGAQELLGYQHVKAKDFSTCTPGNKTYEMVVPEGSEKVRIIFEPNEEMLQAMRDISPRKVIL